MTSTDLKTEICDIENGRFADIVSTFSIYDACSKCDYFNLSVKDAGQAYRCRCAPSCIAATLSPEVASYINWKLGWIDENEHLVNLRV